MAACPTAQDHWMPHAMLGFRVNPRILNSVTRENEVQLMTCIRDVSNRLSKSEQTMQHTGTGTCLSLVSVCDGQ